MVYNLSLKLMNDVDKAENVLQDTFLKVFDKLDTFKGDSSLQTWIYRITTNTALMALRKRNGLAIPLAEDTDSENKGKYEAMLRSLDSDPLELLMDTEFKQAIEKAMSQLQDSWRIPFILKDVEGLSLKEVANTLDTTVPSVKASLHRARNSLRNQLADFIEQRKETSL